VNGYTFIDKEGNMKKFVLVFGLLTSMVAMAFASGMQDRRSAEPLIIPIEVITAANPVNQESTSMVYIDSDVDILKFDKAVVRWLGNENPAIGVIIPSGVHKLSGHTKGGILNQSVTDDFKPHCFYGIFFEEKKLVCAEITDWRYYSYFREKIEQKIAEEVLLTALAELERSGAINRSVKTLIVSLNKQETIAIVSVSSSSHDISQFIADEIEVELLRNKCIVIDRGSLDKIREEQRFQLSGEVDEQSAVSIGKIAGAKVVIIGSISGTGSLRRLRLRALNTENARVFGAASEAF
jgi:hypothetical protein